MGGQASQRRAQALRAELPHVVRSYGALAQTTTGHQEGSYGVWSLAFAYVERRALYSHDIAR
jgi:hypothetical protein